MANKKRVIMTNISGPVKPVDYHPEVSEPTASLIDFLEARRRLSSESEGSAQEAEIAQGHRKAGYWLIALAALVSLLVGILWLMESATPQTASTDQLRLAAGGEPSQGEVTLGQAIQALGVRH
jgi:hypothetical protein